MKRQRIVILGGTGFVGSHLAPRLHADGHTIIVLSRNREQHRELTVLPRARVVTCDVYDSDALRKQLQGADVCVNLVGILNAHGRAACPEAAIGVDHQRSRLADIKPIGVAVELYLP